MLSQTVIYQDFNDNTQTDTLYFHLSEMEWLDLDMNAHEGKFKDVVEKAVRENDAKTMFNLFKQLVDKSYGRKSEDGRRFLKNADLLEEFKDSEAYNSFFVDLMSDINKAAAFFNGLMPNKLLDRVKDKTPEQIRLESEQAMQGFQKKQEKANPEVVSTPEAFQNVAAVTPPNVSEMTEEQKAELRRQLG